MTYYDPSTMIFAGLGHAVCDVDTGETLPLGKGEIVDVTITSVEKGISGQPGVHCRAALRAAVWLDSWQ